MEATDIRLLDYVRIVKPKAVGVITLDPMSIAALNFYDGAIGRVVGNKSGEQFTVWFPVPGYPEPKPQLVTFRPVNLELVKRNDSWVGLLESQKIPTAAEINKAMYPPSQPEIRPEVRTMGEEESVVATRMAARSNL